MQYVSIRYTRALGARPASSPRSAASATVLTTRSPRPIIGLYKAEVIHRRGPWRSFEAVEFATLEWVDWFNHRRLLEPIGNVPPAEAEARYYAQREVLPEPRDPSQNASEKPGAVHRETGPRDRAWMTGPLSSGRSLEAEEDSPEPTGLGTRGLLIRRTITDQDLAFFSPWCPAGTLRETLVRGEGHRWAIEDAFETAQTELGLAHNETRSWPGWHRHGSLVMLAFAMMAVVRQHAHRLTSPPKRTDEGRLQRWSAGLGHPPGRHTPRPSAGSSLPS